LPSTSGVGRRPKATGVQMKVLVVKFVGNLCHAQLADSSPKA
jgi:hypothetical protein